VSLSVFIALTSASALAQDAADAQSAFAAGEAAFDAEDLETALSHFERAYVIAPRDAILFNVAICHERLGHDRAAAERFEHVAQSEEVSDETRALARDGYARTRLELGTLRIEGEPRGATVTIDDEVTWVIPCQVDLDTGERRVVVTVDDRIEEETATITRGGTAVIHIDLAPVAPIARPMLDPVVEDEPRPRRGFPRWATWLGTGLIVAGGAGLIGFGLQTAALEEQYLEMPTSETRDEGLLMRTLANVSIGVMALGAALILIDLLWPSSD
jgi:hypothetical protein